MSLKSRMSARSGRVSAVRQVISTTNLTKKPRKDSFLPDAVGRSIDLAKTLSSVGSLTPVPWISAAADAVVKVLQVVQVCRTS